MSREKKKPLRGKDNQQVDEQELAPVPEENGESKLRGIKIAAERRGLLPIDRSKLTYCSMLATGDPIPTFEGLYYLDYSFVCKDCGKSEVWTGAQQKWWYEEKGGVFESLAVRCHECLTRKREQKNEARRISEEGKLRKQQSKESQRPHSS